MADEDRLATHLRRLVGERPAVVALSGGADSAVVAWLAARAAVPIRAVHVHHGQSASDSLAEAAEAVAAFVGMPCELVHVEVPGGTSFETAAREERYAALLGAMAPEEVLLVGHTSDDQAETVLMRLARGAGPAGLAAMRPVSGRIIRPLLGVPRSDVRSLADGASLPYRDDPANLDRRHSRVVVREDILPTFEQIQPGATRAMARHADLAHHADNLIRGQAAWPVQGRRLAVAAYRSMEPVLQPHALRILAARANRTVPGADALARMHAVAAGRAVSAQVDEGFEIVRVGAYVELVRACPIPSAPARLSAGTSDWGDWRFEVAIHRGRPPAWPLHAGRAVVPGQGTLTVRPLQPGDRHRSRRIDEEMARLPGFARRCWPAVELDGHLIWVPQVRRVEAGSIAPDDDSYRWIIADRRDQWTSERS